MRSSLCVALPVLLMAACSSGGSSAGPAAPLVLQAGLETVAAAAADDITPRVDLQRVGVGSLHASPARTYELTTPAGVPFAFDVVTVAGDNAGWVSVEVAHLLDGTATPTGGVTSIAAAGLVVSGPGLFLDGRNDNWLAVDGSGMTRLSLRGSIERDQVLAFTAEVPVPGDGNGARRKETVLVEIAIGALSPINTAAADASNDPDVVSDTTIYSSDAWNFGMPAIAVSGDRTSVIVYEGDRLDVASATRYEQRLQHDATTNAVTGGAAMALGADSGNWRDHEIAALYNVLAVAQGTQDGVTLRLSFDRGATFPQEEAFVAVGGIGASARIVQTAIAGDYTLALCYWDGDATASRLLLVEGWPSGFDGGGSPTGYSFAAPVVVHEVAQQVMPMPMGVQWSAGGDLVIGYGYSYWTMGGWTSETVTTYRCAIRPWLGEFNDLAVDEERMLARDPSVALLGSGSTLQVFYAYEMVVGIAVVRIADGVVDAASARLAGAPGASVPTVFVRLQDGAPRVDVFYIAAGQAGFELHRSRWQVFPSSAEEQFRLTSSSMTLTAIANPTLPYGLRVKQLAWFGYDVVQDGDDLVVVLDEEQYDALFLCYGAPMRGSVQSGEVSSTTGLPPIFSHASPPPLAPGMTLPVPAVDGAHRHQLRLLRLQ